jgi:hypothetical protein
MATAVLRRVFGVLLSLLLAGLFVGASAGTAHAEDGYRYWNYFHLDNGAWAFSDKGVGQYTPKDGEVEGLRFGTSTASAGIEPRADLNEVTFDTVCLEDAPAGQKRVALVLDFGTEADADGAEVPEPRALCAVVPAKATTLQAIESVLDVRAEGGMMCAIDGYPVKGCGTPVKDADVPAQEQTVAFAMPTPVDPDAADQAADGQAADGQAAGSSDSSQAADAGTDDGNLAWPLVGVGAAVVLIGGGALALNRRRSA